MLYGYYNHVASYRNVIYYISTLFKPSCFVYSDVPWYADSEWNNVKGQLSTVDRNYGHVHSVIHSIGTHQIHHLFTKVPHYHLGME
jgi:omega-3 fatty acid desaturase (delta-15 desaturase)